MQTRNDLHGELEGALKARGAKRRGDIISFRCPRHDDKTASAFMGGGAWGCSACGITEPIERLAEELGIEVQANGYTLEDYAEEKGLNAQRLAELGLATEEGNGRSYIAIPYYDWNGEHFRTKYRGPNKKFWNSAGSQGLLPYGLWLLAKAEPERAVLLVEGESDVHACYQHDILSLGIPGANSWRREWADYLRDRDVYIWQETDPAGELFVRDIGRDLPRARVIVQKEYKDPLALHQATGKDFKSALGRLVAESLPVGTRPPSVQFHTMLGDNLNRLLDRKLQPIHAVPTPFPGWNAICRGEGGRRGLAYGWTVLGAAPSGKGKSILGCNAAVSAAEAGEEATFITLEMSEDELMTRCLAIASGTPISALEQGPYFDRGAFKAAIAYMDDLEQRTGGVVRVNERPIRKLQDILDAIRYNHEVFGSRFFVVDYLQLAWTGKANDLFSRIVEVSHSIRGLVKDLAVAHLGLSQYNREQSKSDERPRKEGLMGGSSLENDSEQVILLWGRGKLSDHERAIVGIVDKNRHGPEADIGIVFDTTTLRLYEDPRILEGRSHG